MGVEVGGVQLRIVEGKISFAVDGEGEVTFGGGFNVKTVLLGRYVERSASAGIVDVGQCVHAHEIPVDAAIIDIAAEGILPDAIVVLALIDKLLENVTGVSVFVRQQNLNNLRIHERERQTGFRV